jgi:N-acetylneuraminate synthase
VSHSKLACNRFKHSFKEFVDLVGPHTAHLHIADALGVDGEGLQIGEGDTDFIALSEDLARTCPQASFIPEIWQGHNNEGEGFWYALAHLEGIF